MEPINGNSWLFLAQFSIAFFLLNIFRNILQKYQQELKSVFYSLFKNKDSNDSVINQQTISDKPNEQEKQKFKIIQTVEKNLKTLLELILFCLK